MATCIATACQGPFRCRHHDGRYACIMYPLGGAVPIRQGGAVAAALNAVRHVLDDGQHHPVGGEVQEVQDAARGGGAAESPTRRRLRTTENGTHTTPPHERKTKTHKAPRIWGLPLPKSLCGWLLGGSLQTRVARGAGAPRRSENWARAVKPRNRNRGGGPVGHP